MGALAFRFDEVFAANDNASPCGLCATSNWVGIDYGYDNTHKLTTNGATDSRIMGNLPTAGTYGAANAINQVAVVPNRTPLTWSDAGNMQSDGRGNTFTHDGNNRLVKATKADGTVLDFRYDGDTSSPFGLRRTSGLRMETIKNATGTAANLQLVGGLHTRYVTSATEEIADLAETRAVIRRYVAGPAIDERIAQVDANGAVTYIHTDKQNSVVALTNATGNPISRRGYGEYGQTSATQMAEFTHPFGYTGRRYEAELGLYYYRARWYDPELGTFLETDPIGSLDYINLYSYVGLDPMGATDPTGLEAACVTLNVPCLRPGVDPFGDFIRGFNNPDSLMGTGISFIPVVGDIQSFDYARRNPSTFNYGVAVVGIVPLAGDAAGKIAREVHHIVPVAARRAAEAQRVLENLGVSVRSFNANLVSLPRDVHRVLHRNKYMDYVNAEIRNAENVEDLTARLNRMASELSSLKSVEDVNARFPRAPRR